MSGMFVSAAEVVREEPDWGRLAWCCRPTGTEMKNLVVIEVTLSPGGGHAFHKHPRQEEVIYCIEGQVEQWLDQEKQVLTAGDAVVIPSDVVHASFNTSQAEAKLLAILGPAIDDQNGYEVIEVADQAPWCDLC
ncbi:MAG: cupin domain-containing protein [Planctomycetota bacterium]